MKNLVEQSASWLQSKECRNGGIMNRTAYVISAFRNYVAGNKVEISKTTGLPYIAIIKND